MRTWTCKRCFLETSADHSPNDCLSALRSRVSKLETIRDDNVASMVDKLGSPEGAIKEICSRFGLEEVVVYKNIASPSEKEKLKNLWNGQFMTGKQPSGIISTQVKERKVSIEQENEYKYLVVNGLRVLMTRRAVRLQDEPRKISHLEDIVPLRNSDGFDLCLRPIGASYSFSTYRLINDRNFAVYLPKIAVPRHNERWIFRKCSVHQPNDSNISIKMSYHLPLPDYASGGKSYKERVICGCLYPALQ